MQCKELAIFIEREGLTPLSLEAQEHLAECTTCQNLFADFSAIVVAAGQLPAELEPPDRVWISVRAQLVAEGLIRERQPIVAAPAATWWRNIAELLRPRVLAPAALSFALILGGVYYLGNHRTPTVAVHPASSPAPASESTKTVVPPAAKPTAPIPANPAPELRPYAKSTPPLKPRESRTELRPSPSESAYFGDSAAVLSQTESDLPSRRLANNAAVDASLRQNLRTVNEFIAECEARLKQNPQDQLTREYLNIAYQQKAELLTAIMDTGRSEH